VESQEIPSVQHQVAVAQVVLLTAVQEALVQLTQAAAAVVAHLTQVQVAQVDLELSLSLTLILFQFLQLSVAL
jgi:hypothetical protein